MEVFLIDSNSQALEVLAKQLRGTQPTADIHTFPDRAALARWLEENRPARLRVQTFGNFEVFWGEQPVHFRRSRTKELFAYLVDRRGAGSTMGELISVLWEGRPDTGSVRSQLRSLITDLRATFRDLGVEDVIIKGRDYIALDPARVDCDYYRYLAGERAVRAAFRGEYMSNYSWAEITVGSLQQKK
ncbi:MAG: hypothetical protein IKK50_05430 [Ruminiclostridium sp.]|nr:hypothetical protein [Ruminiclostridium sp.]